MTAILSDAARFVALAAREIQDGEVCFVGIGVPSLAAMCAKRTHAPDAVLIYESGAVDTDPPIPPLSTGSPSVVANAAMVTSCLNVFAMLQQGRFDLGLLSAAQVDRYGNLNSTVLGGPTAKRKVRLVGSGGAHDIGLLAREVIIMMPHDPRRFVDRVDYVTTPGLRTRENGLASMQARGGGPRCLITPRARFSFECGELTLEALADGIDEAQALEGFGWTVPRAATLRRLPPIEAGLAAAAMHLLALWGREAT
jgi:glutaconate CoA-transferase, subunit B